MILKAEKTMTNIEKAIKEFEKDNLIFRQFCFQNSVIDDFLLNFYDGLRDFSLAEKISLKKFVTDNFKEKINEMNFSCYSLKVTDRVKKLWLFYTKKERSQKSESCASFY